MWVLASHLSSSITPFLLSSLTATDDFAPTTEGPYQKVDLATRNFKNLFRPKDKRSTKPVLCKVETDGKKGEVKAEDQMNDSLYICPVEVGTPPQTMNLHFDTGSSDLWVCLRTTNSTAATNTDYTKLWSSELDSRTKNAGSSSRHNIFNPRKSTTYKKLPSHTWRIRYGDGSNASGIVGTDNVTLGGLCIENQAIELASRLSFQFVQGAGDGLLGLGFGKINTVKPKPVKTPVENMMDQDDIPEEQELFTCYLGSWRDKDEVDKGESFYTFGYIDDEIIQRCGTEPHYVPIDPSKGFWQFKSEAATIGGKRVLRPGNTAIADTGTTLALVSDDLCKEIYGQIPGARFDVRQQGWVFPVDIPEEQLPKLTYAIGSKQFEIQKEDFGFAKVGGGMQYGGIQSRGDSEFDIMGDTWLKGELSFSFLRLFRIRVEGGRWKLKLVVKCFANGMFVVGIYAIFDQGKKRFGAVQRVEGRQNVDLPK
jgi:hypothetical protein